MAVDAMVVLPGTLVWAMAPHWQWMIVGTLLWAVSFAGYPAITAYVTASHDDHVGIFGTTFAFFSLGMIVTPGIGGLIATGAGHRSRLDRRDDPGRRVGARHRA
jgi:MFS family permease